MDEDPIDMKECVITKDGVVCKMDEKNHQKMIDQNKIPQDLTIIKEKKTIVNKPIDSSKDTEADSSNKECGCSNTS